LQAQRIWLHQDSLLCPSAHESSSTPWV
jgi:hypothetical protein